jgi:Cu2+-exporting ATPase
MGQATRVLLHWFSALIALPAIAFAGRPFFGSAFEALRHGRTNMDVPIALAIALAAAMSLFETVRGGEHVYFDSAIMLLFFLLVGRYLDRRARGVARSAAERLLAMDAGSVTVLDEDGRRRL